MRDRTEAAAKAKELVSQMTLEEKASQLRYNAPAIERLGIPEYNWWNEALHGVARGGTATVFPQAIGLAAMFDEDLQERIAVSGKVQELFGVRGPSYGPEAETSASGHYHAIIVFVHNTALNSTLAGKPADNT